MNIVGDDAKAIKATSDSLLPAYLRTKGPAGRGSRQTMVGCNGWWMSGRFKGGAVVGERISDEWEHC